MAESKNLPQLLVFGPSLVYTLYASDFSQRFQLLEAFKSTIPLDQYLAAKAGSVEALICSGECKITAELLGKIPSVRLVVTSSKGVNHIDLKECRRRGISVANIEKIFSVDVADTAVGLLIDVLRRISAADRFVRSGLWPVREQYPLGTKLGGKRVGVIGLGSIGLEVAKRLQAFDCKISYNSRTKKPNAPYAFYSNVLQLAQNCDVLVICCALTEETRHMINKEVLNALGKEGIIVNVARGAIIDEKELVDCLVAGKIGGAGLDVFENEPDVPKELFDLDNVVLSAHRAVCTDQSFRESFELIVGNLDAFFQNKPLLSAVVDEQVELKRMLLHTC